MTFYRPPEDGYNLYQMPYQSPLSQPGSPMLRPLGGGAVASATWVATNRAIFVPFHASSPFTIRRFWLLVGATGGTNTVDIGLYDLLGNRLLNHGGVTVGTANQIQHLDVTDTTFGPGAYYLAGVMNGTTATCLRQTYGSETYKITGALQMATAVPLPTTATFAALAATSVPLFGFTNRASP